MHTLNYWTQFEHTGKVEDYLSYVSAQSPDREARETKETGNGEKDQAGANPYAGIHMGNRNDFKTDAYRGI